MRSPGPRYKRRQRPMLVSYGDYRDHVLIDSVDQREWEASKQEAPDFRLDLGSQERIGFDESNYAIELVQEIAT